MAASLLNAGYAFGPRSQGRVLVPRQYRSADDELRAYEAVTLKSVREVLERYPLDRVTTLALGPLKELRAPANGKKRK
jgi:predicted Zn-dependent peptidase